MSPHYQVVLLNTVTTTGPGTALQGDERETSTAVFTVTITGTATVTFQANGDGSNTYYDVPVTSVTASPVTSTTVTTSGLYRCDATGLQIVPNVTSYTSGAVTVVASLETGTLSGGVSSGGGGGGSVTLASGAVASGAYAAGSIASGAAVAGAITDLASLLTFFDTTVYDGTNNAVKFSLAADLTTNSGSLSTVAQVSVGTSSTLILAANTSRKSMAITNQGASTIFLGNTGVTTSTGFALAAGATLSDVTTTVAWYGVVASGTVTAGVIEVS